MTDQQVWNNIVSGDVDALRVLHDRYYCQMLLWACKHVKDESLAEELVSDCFIRLWERRELIFIEKSLKAYLFLMLRNIIVSEFRKSKHLQVQGYDVLPEFPDDAEMQQNEFYAQLYNVIQKLPEQRRRILEFAVYDSLTYKEIAEKLQISVNTVKTQMGRAYQFLKEELDPKSFLLLHFCFKSEKNRK